MPQGNEALRGAGECGRVLAVGHQALPEPRQRRAAFVEKLYEGGAGLGFGQVEIVSHGR
ncbi:hypothetical protein [Arthrobacter sp. ISL-72]|uniref:hypothetical protein n=1 Tax=Arthrobacter sp. ISL-72 TaxID=2819114 RepID=UPI001BE58C05|nr:hypothetical protein [Arthrobacter sp. ISL-72]